MQELRRPKPSNPQLVCFGDGRQLCSAFRLLLTKTSTDLLDGDLESFLEKVYFISIFLGLYSYGLELIAFCTC